MTSPMKKMVVARQITDILTHLGGRGVIYTLPFLFFFSWIPSIIGLSLEFMHIPNTHEQFHINVLTDNTPDVLFWG